MELRIPQSMKHRKSFTILLNLLHLCPEKYQVGQKCSNMILLSKKKKKTASPQDRASPPAALLHPCRAARASPPARVEPDARMVNGNAALAALHRFVSLHLPRHDEVRHRNVASRCPGRNYPSRFFRPKPGAALSPPPTDAICGKAG